MLTCGSLFTGIRGLDRAVEAFFGATTAWVCENDKACAAWLERNYPDVPNLGDITKVNWEEVEPVDIICGGFPCQDLSFAGSRKGIGEGTRSGLWAEYAHAVRVLRPSYVVVENVPGLLAPIRDVDGGGWWPSPIERVVGDLAEAGYVGRWESVRASETGAPHRRERIFLIAWRERDGFRLRPQATTSNGNPRTSERATGSSTSRRARA